MIGLLGELETGGGGVEGDVVENGVDVVRFKMLDEGLAGVGILQEDVEHVGVVDAVGGNAGQADESLIL